MGDSNRMKATAQRTNELLPQLLGSADLGLVVMAKPDSKVQIVAWFASQGARTIGHPSRHDAVDAGGVVDFADFDREFRERIEDSI